MTNDWETGLADLLLLLEQNQAQATCETPGTPWLVGMNRDTRSAVLLKARCGMWSCPACAQRLAARWTARAIHGAAALAETDRRLAMITLTHRGGIVPAKSLARWRNCWPKLSARARRASGGDWEYLYVHEQHKSGVLHTHFLSTDELGIRWWKDNPAETGFGYMNDWEILDNFAGAGAYVAKYLAKQLQLLRWPAGWRRVGTSRGWPALPEMDGAEGWDWVVARHADDVRVELEGLLMQQYALSVDRGIVEILDELGPYCKKMLYPFLTNSIF
jgi:hypothetical protein